MDNRAVQRHLLTRVPENVNQAVTMVEKFFQIGGESHPTKVMTLQEEETPKVPPPPSQMETTMLSIQQQLTQQTTILAKLAENGGRTGTRVPNRPPLKCYECEGPHPKRLCPKLAKANSLQTAEN